MQDRYRFRFWNKETNKWFYFGFETFHIYEKEIWETLTNGEKIYQCTGLKDKHGNLIYEGDLLRYPPKDKGEEINYVICEVFFHNNDCCDRHIGFQMNRFHFKGNLCGIINYDNKYNFLPGNVEKMEVIGNIYENPELLSEVK